MSMAEVDLPEVRQDSTPKGQPKARRASGGARAKAAQESLKDDIEGTLQLLALVWTSRDDVCGPVLDRQAPDIARELNAWLKDHPKARAWIKSFVSAGGSMGLFLAFLPLLKTVQEHHVVPRIEAARQAREQTAEMEADFAAHAPVLSTDEPAQARPLGLIEP